MWIRKFLGTSTLILSALLFVILFLSTAYEVNSFSAYVKALEENKEEIVGLLIIVLYMIFLVPPVFISCILLLIVGVKYLRETAGKKTHIVGLVFKAISAVVLLLEFILYLNLYPSGWVSKIFYITTAVLLFTSFGLDIYLVKLLEKTEVKTEKASKNKTKK